MNDQFTGTAGDVRFFALRTPLLPYGSLVALGGDLTAADSVDDPEELDRAIRRDRRRLQQGMREFLKDLRFREALFLSSPSLFSSLEGALSNPEANLTENQEEALFRYITRMSSRPTPFGLCAGISVGRVGERTRLVLQPISRYERTTRIDARCVRRLVRRITSARQIRERLTWFANPTAFCAAGKLRFGTLSAGAGDEPYQRSAVTADGPLLEVLRLADGGASWPELISHLTGQGHDGSEAEEYISEVADCGIIVPDLDLRVTGADPLRELRNDLQAKDLLPDLTGRLDEILDRLRELDRKGIGVGRPDYRTIEKLWAAIDPEAGEEGLLHVELHKPAEVADLGEDDVSRIKTVAATLHRLFPVRDRLRLEEFRRAFRIRYEDAWVPLLEVLDEDIGLGYPVGGSRAGGDRLSPRAPGITTEQPTSYSDRMGPIEKFMLEKLIEARVHQRREITLNRGELEPYYAANPDPLPAAYQIWVQLRAADSVSPGPEVREIHVESASGPSGIRTIGRFCNGNEILRDAVQDHVRREEAEQPDTLFAELVTVCSRGSDNSAIRPRFRDYEIQLFAGGAAKNQYRIRPADILVAVEKNRVVLRHRESGRLIAPRMSTAVNFARTIGTPIQKFLSDVEVQGVSSGAAWHWGALDTLPFLPRVKVDGVLLALARWRVARAELGGPDVALPELFANMQRWRKRNGVPRFVELVKRSGGLFLDLENILCMAAIAKVIRRKSGITLCETFSPTAEPVVTSREGGFVNELIIPVNRSLADHERNDPGPGTHLPERIRHDDLIIPGEDWLYAKVYCSESQGDHVIHLVRSEFLNGIDSNGEPWNWFFIRYHDPDFHLRIRIHGSPSVLLAEAMPGLSRVFRPLIDDGAIYRVAYESYRRETSRYGGREGIRLLEKVFHADSDAFGSILAAYPGEKMQWARFPLTVLNMNLLMDDCGLSLNRKIDLVRSRQQALELRLGVTAKQKREVLKLFRTRRPLFEALLSGDHVGESAEVFQPGILALKHRSAATAPILRTLSEMSDQGRLNRPLTEILPSLLHMTVNRFMRDDFLMKEYVCFTYLDRLLASQKARETS